MSITPNRNQDGQIISYRAVVYHKRRKVVQKNFKTKSEAKAWYEYQLWKFKQGYSFRFPFEKACEDWLEIYQKPRCSPATYIEYKRLVETSFLPEFGEMYLDEISVNDIERFRDKLRFSKSKNKPRSNSTINKHMSTLKCLFNYYCKKEVIRKNPVKILGMLPCDPKEASIFTLDQIKALLQYANQKYENENRWVYVFYLLCLNTGMRVGEVLGLQWDCVDFLNRMLVVKRSYCTKSQRVRESTKNRKIRYVGLNSCLYPELKKLWKHRSPEQNLVFCNSRGNPLNLSNFKRSFYKPDLFEANLPQLKIQELRHSFASHFMMNGGSLYTLQKLLGHECVRSTERYSHCIPNAIIHQTELVSISGYNNVIDLDKERKRKQTKKMHPDGIP